MVSRNNTTHNTQHNLRQPTHTIVNYFGPEGVGESGVSAGWGCNCERSNLII